MKIKVADIEPNPFRKIEQYPIDEEKVKALMNSITEKTFWDNILVRSHPEKKGKFQLAYGHHRHIAIQRLKIKEINIPVRELNNAVMIQIMAEENLDWSTSPAVMIQTIISAKEFIDGEISKYKTWD
jgi:ParB/RepB/Spo0J family partition protein